MADGKSGPIIIKKIKKNEGHHGGAWKVAYADFVTAMMALFIVLWVLGQDDHVVESVAKYFKDPIGFNDKGKSVIEGKTSILIDPELEMAQKNRELEKQELKNMGEKILTELSEDESFVSIMDQIKIEIIDEGLRIELIESTDDIFFEIGTSNLKSKTEQLLVKIGNQLTKIPNKIVIEGHTDSRPYSGNGRAYSNYELSSERANAARRALMLSSLKEGRIDEIRGYADKRLANSKDPYAVINRRISIIVKYSK